MAEYTVVSGDKDTAVVTVSEPATKTVRIDELLRNIADMKSAAEGKVASHNRFVDELQALSDATKLDIDVPEKITVN